MIFFCLTRWWKPKPIKENIKELEDSKELACRILFDEAFYLTTYPDIAAAKVDAFEHFINYGYAEGRSPLSLQAPDAAIKIRTALNHDAKNIIAIGLHIRLELESDDFERILAATAVYQTTFFSAPDTILFDNTFAHAALRLFGKCFRWEITANIAQLRDILHAFLLSFPQSNTINALYSLCLFELGDLNGTEQVLANLSNWQELTPDLALYCRNTQRQLTEASLINQSEAQPSTLMLFDSAFPSKISSFRYGEFSNYLKAFDSSTIHIKPDDNIYRYGESLSFPQQVETFCSEHLISANRLRRFDVNTLGASKVAYCVFLSCADLLYTQIGLPLTKHFLFTLYPGGGFLLNNQKSDTMLRNLCDNTKLAKIITTQIASYRYLIDGGFCEPDRIKHIYGGIIPDLYQENVIEPQSRCLENAMHVCFVAQRYSLIGAEKGYDVFIEVVKKFANSKKIHFHVVGGFDETTINIGLTHNITFYGIQSAAFFTDFYPKMDVILSPNIHHSALDPSQPESFDGFPTTCVVEAGLRGVAMFLTDFKNMNQRLDGTPIYSSGEMKIIDRNPDSIAQLLEHYLHDRQSLAALGELGRRAILRELNFENQMQPRIQLIESYLAL